MTINHFIKILHDQGREASPRPPLESKMNRRIIHWVWVAGISSVLVFTARDVMAACNAPDGTEVKLDYSINPSRDIFDIGETATMTLLVDGVPYATEPLNTSVVSTKASDKHHTMTYADGTEDSPGDCSITFDYTVVKVEITGVKKFGITKMFTLSSDVNPAGGTYSWSVSGTAFSITGANNGASCTFKADCAEGSADVTLTYAYSGKSCSNTKTVQIKKPTGETTSWIGWNVTVGQWSGALTPADVDFGGIQVTERDGGGGADTCWFSGSIYAKFDALSGGTWGVGAGNLWQTDNVGWFSGSVTYYRNQGRAPCGFTLSQRMDVVCPAGNIEYKSNGLGAQITATNVSSTRDGQTQTTTWP